MRQTRIAIGLHVVGADLASLARDQGRGDAAVGTGNRLRDAPCHGETQILDAGHQAIERARRRGGFQGLWRAIGEAHRTDAVEIGPAREIIAVRHGGFGWRAQHGERRHDRARLRGGDRFGADQSQTNIAGRRGLPIAERGHGNNNARSVGRLDIDAFDPARERNRSEVARDHGRIDQEGAELGRGKAKRSGCDQNKEKPHHGSRIPRRAQGAEKPDESDGAGKPQ